MSARRLFRHAADALISPWALFRGGPDVHGLWIMVGCAMAAVAAAYAFWNSDTGHSVLLAAQQATFARFSAVLSVEQYRQMLAHATPLQSLVQAQMSAVVLRVFLSRMVFALLVIPLLALLFAVPAVRWRDMLALVGAGSPILVIRESVILLLSYSRNTPATEASIWHLAGQAGGCCGAEGPVASSTNYVAAFLTNADPFTVWWLVVVSLAFGNAYLDGRWRGCAIVLLSGWLAITSLGGYFTLHTSNALATGRPAHQRLF